MNDHHDVDRELAPWHPIPSRPISAVEHPCIIKNVDKGIVSLGGPVKLSKSLRSDLNTTTTARGDDELTRLVSVSLRPDDPFAKRLLSTPVRTNNILLKITAPRRTGRKRKRHSSGAFECDHGPHLDVRCRLVNDMPNHDSSYVPASIVHRSLRDNPKACTVTVAGIIEETHRFRAMPDLQYSASQSFMMTGLRDHVLSRQYTSIKNYPLHTAPGPNLAVHVAPPPEFLQMPVAHNYRFQQNPHVRYTNHGFVNSNRRIAADANVVIKPTDQQTPMSPKANLPTEESLSPELQVMICQIKEQLRIRPIVTRHLLYNKHGWDKRTKVRQAAAYCGYFFETGPWREALVKWGVDPRQNPEFRRYQTVSFSSYLKSSASDYHKAFAQHIRNLSRVSPKDLEAEHIFDGVHISRTGNLFQFCDITDPLIAKLLSTTDIRTTCAPTFQGWYHVGTWAKATVILKDKMNALIANKKPDNSMYHRIVAWPELWDDQTIAATYQGEVNNRDNDEATKREHAVMYHVRIAARNPRYAFEKMEAATLQGHELVLDKDVREEVVPVDVTEDPGTVEDVADAGWEAEERDDDCSEVTDEASEPEAEVMWDRASREAEGYGNNEDALTLAPNARASPKGSTPFGGFYQI